MSFFNKCQQQHTARFEETDTIFILPSYCDQALPPSVRTRKIQIMY